MSKPIPIIEHQKTRQRTPIEAVNFIKDEIDRGNVTNMMIIYNNEKTTSYLPSSVNREYSRASILWDVVQWFKNYV